MTARVLLIAVAVSGYFVVLERVASDFGRAIHMTKLAVAALCAAAFFYERLRARDLGRRPLPEGAKKFVGVTLGALSIVLYFNAFKVDYRKWYHRHDQYHYYIGAKYFPELGYDRLYRCTAIAEDELGPVTDEMGRRFDLRKEVRRASWKVRDLGGTNLLISAQEVLVEPALCKDHFSPERWESFKHDITFFRLESDRGYWQGMQKDHGFNPSPVWSLGGRLFVERMPASVPFQQFLGALDVVLNLGMFAAIYWAFGWRVFAVAAVVWGCEGAADPYYWTGGSLLRQDWLFFSVLALCLARKRYPALAAASLVYAALLRVFPGLMVAGWLVVAGHHLVRHKKIAPTHGRMLLGGTVAAAVLVLASCYYVGVGATMRERWQSSYAAFYQHTIVVHDQTPLANHMGLRVLMAHEPGLASALAKRSEAFVDPSQVWMEMRKARYAKYKWIGWLATLGVLAAFVHSMRQVRLLWVAQGLSIIWVILLSQLTNYYYGFVLCAVPLIVIRREIELLFYGYAVVTEIIWLAVRCNEDKYAMHTIAAILLSLGSMALVWRKHRRIPRSASV